MKTRAEVTALISTALLEIIPDLSKGQLSYDDAFIELGANSVDRGELITLTIERLELDASLIEFAMAYSINSLADLVMAKMGQAVS
jgi:polyketide biosynthesis acyl carrier protein